VIAICTYGQCLPQTYQRWLGCQGGTPVFADNQLPTIKISASVISKKVIAMSSSGVPTEEVAVTRRVSYSDLDLKTYAGALALKRRVQKAARLACKQLDELYPLEQPHAPSCIKETVAAANPQVEAAIGAAQRNAAK
jgi:UrcA family protein